MATTTLTLELPEMLAAQISALPESDRNQYAISALAVGMNALSAAEAEDISWWNSLTPEEQDASRAALARSLADADAGRLSSGEDVFARIRAKHTGQKR